MKKKVVFYAYSLDIGGIETSLYNLLNELANKDYDITLVLEEKKGIFLDSIDKRINILEYKISKIKNVLLRKIINFSKRIIWTLKYKNKFDCSICYATYSIPCAVLALISSRNNYFYVHSNYQFIYPDKNEYMKFFNDRKIEQFKNIVFVSSEAREYFNKVYGSLKGKTLTIGNIVNYKKIIDLSKKEIEYKKDKDTKLFVFVGRLDDHAKKLGRAIRLINSLNEKSIKSKLLIIGDGQDKDLYLNEVKKYNEEYYEFLGVKKNPYPYIKLADYIILTSDYEGFPVLYWEAVVLNKKLITTISVSDGSLNVPNDYGVLISKDEDKMLDEVIKYIKEDKFNNDEVDVLNVNLDKVKRVEELINK